jgi:integrase
MFLTIKETRSIRCMVGNGDRPEKKAGLPEVWAHDLKHTFGRRLRAAGVIFEDRQDLLGHKSGRVTKHLHTLHDMREAN